jgi:lipopolysaccharide export system permease protein
MLLRRNTRYILSLLLWPTVLITFSLCAIIWLMQTLRFVDFIINRGLSVGNFMYLTMLILPSLLTVILPVALLIAVSFTFHRIYSESELVAMQASGFSRLQLARPAMIAGLAGVALTYLFSLYLLPSANRQFEDMRGFLRDNYASVLLQEEVFNHPVDGMTVFIRERLADGKLSGILVHDNRDAQNVVTMMAEEARLVQTEAGPRFLLRSGLRQERRDGRVSWLNFDSYALDLRYYTDNQMERTRDVDELYLQELTTRAANPANGEARAELHNRLAWPWLALALPLVALTILTGGQFNRRGMWQRVTVTAGVTIALVLGFFGLLNVVVTYPAAVPALYAYLGAMILGAVSMLADWRRVPNKLTATPKDTKKHISKKYTFA